MPRQKAIAPTPVDARSAGRLQVYWSEKWQRYVIAAWPKGNGGDTPKRANARAEFSQAVKLIKLACGLDTIGAMKQSHRTEFLPRDFLMKAAFGTLLEVVDSEGTTWKGVRVLQKEIETLLSSISDIPGCIIYRNNDEWVALLPGSPTDVLTLSEDTGLPEWLPPSGTPGSTTLFSRNTPAGSSSSAHATKGALVIPLLDVDVSKLWFHFTPASGGHYVAGIYQLDGSNVITAVIAQSAEFIAPSAASRDMLFTCAASLTTGTRYLFALTRTDSTGTASAGLNAGDGNMDAFPCEYTDLFLTADTATPGIGTACTSGANPYAHGALFTF